MRRLHFHMFMISMLVAPACLILIASSWPGNVALDLYRVFISSHDDAASLASLSIDPLLRISDGYLVLASAQDLNALAASGLRYELIATGVDRSHLAVHIGHDPARTAVYETIFQEGGRRIVRIDSGISASERYSSGLAPIPVTDIPIVHRPSMSLDKWTALPASLDSLINLVREDSIISYSEYLESLDGRLTMTYGAFQARNYLISKFADFGYDSVFIDTFTGNGFHRFVTGHNVIAVKPGTVNPYHHIIIGAHYDSPWAFDSPGVSPGADDDGSGTVAVMEIARALSDIETRQTFVFVLFDAEEEGKVGSRGYADSAYADGDRVALMINMDMIGHFENDSEAYVFWGADSLLGALWATLADSLPGIDIFVHPRPNTLSDDEGFFNRGWHTLGVHEYVFSTFYHSYRDSTTYLNFDYLARVARASLATAYTVDRQFVPDRELWMAAAADLPEIVIPNTPTPIDVYIREYGDAQLVPGSAQLHYDINGGTTVSVSMNAVGAGLFTAELPPLPCLDKIRFFITAEEMSLGIFFLPSSGTRAGAVSATGLYTFFEDDFGSNTGWTVTGNAAWGHWRREEVEETYWGVHNDDYDNNGWCFITGTTDFENVNGGTTTLISPPIETSRQDALIEYARWYDNRGGEEPNTEVLVVYMSINDGDSWYPIETVGPVEQADGSWHINRFWISDFVNPPPTIRLRFDASDFGADTYVKAAVDAVKFMTFSTDTRILSDEVPSWTGGHPYSYQLVAGVCEGDVIWADRFGQLDGTGITLSVDGYLSGIPLDGRAVAFTAQVSDPFGGYDEKRFSFIIHDSLRITTGAVAATSVDEEYKFQLYSTGGTGDKTWSDRDGDLAGSGVSLASNGYLSGIPVEAGDFPFVARVTDEVGAAAEKAFTLRIIGSYVCGDASGDSAVNVADAVWIINYVFSGGPAPYPIEAGDANADGTVTVADAVYIINYIFKGGPEPECP